MPSIIIHDQSTLEFRLRLQEYIVLVKANDLVAAIDYARKQLQKFDTETELLQTLTRAMGLLALRKDTRGNNSNYLV